MKLFKLYFLKSDTPFEQGYQRKKRYHTTWSNKPSKVVDKHKTFKIKLFGFITVYKLKRGIRV